ncbi:hypothetical protein [Caulobacter sp. FWC2]|uniref:hypothetical protein n=1 Tax=Caulobacter sp. FWC2 TaxID=69664 RepID=UPI000C15DB9E|nr:hypothetical protein [Caulobacter sp. FWC2]PIB92737.1 hypothetical protein CSW62_14895 [Caulobacter sp. FWC2]
MLGLDPRLLDLIETLSASGLDWLAFELIEGIRRGEQPLESEENLDVARTVVRSGQEGASWESGAAETPVKATALEDQIKWAADYVVMRLDDALGQLDASIGNLEDVCRHGRERLKSFSDVQHVGPMTVVIDDEVARKTDREAVHTARLALADLRQAIAIWRIGEAGIEIT